MRYPAAPEAMITQMGLAFRKSSAAKAPPNRSQLHQSMKLYGVMSMMAAAAIMPIVTGRITFRMAAK